MSVSNEDAEQFVADREQEVKDEVKAVEPRLTELASSMGELRTQLYTKFGTNINLDSNPSDAQSHLRKS